VPAARLDVVTLSAGLMVSVTVCVSESGEFFEFFTVTGKLKLPAAFGVPETTPELLSMSPAGAVPLHVNGG
jgi:hypothetical protein